MSNEELGRLFPIILSEYQESWKRLFQDENKVIMDFIGKDLIRIDHIGSTSVPGFIAKPTIDILVEIAEGTNLEKLIDSFEEHGYNYIAQPQKDAPQMMYTKGYTIHGFEGQPFQGKGGFCAEDIMFGEDGEEKSLFLSEMI